MKLISQILSILAFIFFLLSIQNKDKKKILGMQFVSNTFYTIAYFLIDAMSAVFIDFVSTIRCFLYAHFEIQKKNTPIIIMIMLIIISIGVGLFTVHNIYDTLPIIISIIYIVTTWQKDIKVIQIGYIVAAFIWIIYNIHLKMYAPLIGNFFEIISGLIAMYRIKNSDREKIIN